MGIMPDLLLPPLAENERSDLLALARLSVEARANHRPAPALPVAPSRLLAPQGAFVTLKLREHLRGCIGIVAALHPLAEIVARCAEAAASEDPRFPPLQPVELEGLTIEISVLDPPFRVRDLSRIVIGRHGLMVTEADRRGVLLPQVAVEQNWDVRRFVQETFLKAGLAPDEGERGAILEAFSAQVFAEKRAEASEPPPSPPPRSPAPRR
jgi:AmmeMemoRadiSam system protein A